MQAVPGAEHHTHGTATIPAVRRACGQGLVGLPSEVHHGLTVPRLFVCLELPDFQRELLAELCHSVQGAHWIDPDQFHITVAFVDEVDAPLARRIEDSLALVRAPVPHLQIQGLGHFPPRGEPRVLWAGVAPDPALTRLRRAVMARLRSCDAPVDSRRYAPHVTLARLQRAPLPQLHAWFVAREPFSAPPFSVEHVVLKESISANEGTLHRTLALYRLD